MNYKGITAALAQWQSRYLAGIDPGLDSAIRTGANPACEELD